MQLTRPFSPHNKLVKLPRWTQHDNTSETVTASFTSMKPQNITPFAVLMLTKFYSVSWHNDVNWTITQSR